MGGDSNRWCCRTSRASASKATALRVIAAESSAEQWSSIGWPQLANLITAHGSCVTGGEYIGAVPARTRRSTDTAAARPGAPIMGHVGNRNVNETC